MIRGNDIYNVLENYAEESAKIIKFQSQAEGVIGYEKLIRYKIVDPVSVISVCLLFRNYELAFPFDIVPDFDNLNGNILTQIKNHHQDLLRHVEVYFEVGEFKSLPDKPYISISSIDVISIDLKDEHVFDTIFLRNFIRNKNSVKKTNRKILKSKNQITTVYKLSYSIKHENER